MMTVDSWRDSKHSHCDRIQFQDCGGVVVKPASQVDSVFQTLIFALACFTKNPGFAGHNNNGWIVVSLRIIETKETMNESVVHICKEIAVDIAL